MLDQNTNAREHVAAFLDGNAVEEGVVTVVEPSGLELCGDGGALTGDRRHVGICEAELAEGLGGEAGPRAGVGAREAQPAEDHVLVEHVAELIEADDLVAEATVLLGVVEVGLVDLLVVGRGVELRVGFLDGFGGLGLEEAKGAALDQVLGTGVFVLGNAGLAVVVAGERLELVEDPAHLAVEAPHKGLRLRHGQRGIARDGIEHVVCRVVQAVGV